MPSKSLKLNLCVTFLLGEINELLMNLGEAFHKFQKSIQESSGFSFQSFLQMI